MRHSAGASSGLRCHVRRRSSARRRGAMFAPFQPRTQARRECPPLERPSHCQMARRGRFNRGGSTGPEPIDAPRPPRPTEVRQWPSCRVRPYRRVHPQHPGLLARPRLASCPCSNSWPGAFLSVFLPTGTSLVCESDPQPGSRSPSHARRGPRLRANSWLWPRVLIQPALANGLPPDDQCAASPSTRETPRMAIVSVVSDVVRGPRSTGTVNSSARAV
jgi:hypothetical protein